VVVVVTSAVGVRAFLDVPDMRTAMAHALPVILGLGLATALAGLLEAEAPGLGGLVPVGGLAIALTKGSTSAPLAALTALLAAAFLLWDAARALDRLLVRAGALGRTAARRARGDYLPEVALLTLVAAAGSSAWAPPELVLPDIGARTALSMVLFLALPALFISVPLELSRRELLFWRAPPLRAWLLVPPMVAGTLTAGNYLWQLGVWLFPSSMIDAYADLLGGFDTPFGLVAVSLVPGICEELLFRGAIFSLLRRRFPTWAALVGQAALFAVLHAIGARLPYTFALGLVFGLLVWRTGSLWPAILAHAAHNFLATQIPPERMEAWLAHPAAWAVAAVPLAAAWFAGSVPLWKREDRGSTSRR
jgi:membrane protease YdiL (CAAX protease family)